MITNIVMVVRDRYELTRQALDSLFNTLRLPDFNLTLVDDGSDFRMRKLLECHLGLDNVSVIHLAKSSHVVAQIKNIGVECSRQYFGEGDFLYLSDNDVYFLPGWLDRLTTAAIATEEIGAWLWGGQIHPFHHTHTVIGWPTGTEAADVLDGPSWLMRWKVWNYIGGLSRECAPGVCQSEDADFCRKIVERRGGIGVMIPHVVIHTGLTNTDGEKSPGYDIRVSQKREGIYYE